MKYQFINDLEKFLNEFQELKDNYDKALNCIQTYRLEKAALINCIMNNNVEKYKEMFVSKDWQHQIERLQDWKLVTEEIKHHPTGWIEQLSETK